jgi:hypothetical protein
MDQVYRSEATVTGQGKNRMKPRPMHKILITAFQHDAGRIARLNRSLGYAEALLETQGEPSLFPYLHSIHDHKGELEVVWLREPHDLQRKALECAWEKLGNERVDKVEHLLPEGEPELEHLEEQRAVSRNPQR